MTAILSKSNRSGWVSTASVSAVFLCACGGSDGSGTTDAGPTIDATSLVDAAVPDAAAARCDQIKPLPLAASNVTTLEGFSGAEDFAFDDKGNLVSVDFRGGGTVTAQPRTGEAKPLGTGTASFADSAGTAFLANGDLLVNIPNDSQGRVVRIDPTGSDTDLARGINYPNGIAVSQSGLVYVAALDSGILIEIDPQKEVGNNSKTIATGLEKPNGLAFSPDYQTLYVGSFGGGTVHRVEADGSGGWKAPILHGEINSGDAFGGGLDGIGVDACGNVYVTEYIHGKLWRLPPEGGPPTLVIQLVQEEGGWIPNLHWGSGVGGWSKDKLYVSERNERRIFELDLGVSGAPAIFP